MQSENMSNSFERSSVLDEELKKEQQNNEVIDLEKKACTCTVHDKIDVLLSKDEKLEQLRKGVMNSTDFFLKQVTLDEDHNLEYLQTLATDMYDMQARRATEVSSKEILKLTVRRNKIIFVRMYRGLCPDGREGAPKDSKLPKANDNFVFRAPAGYPGGHFEKDHYYLDDNFKEELLVEAKKGIYFYYTIIVHQGCAAMKHNEQQIVNSTEKTNNPIPLMNDGGLYRDIELKSTFLAQMEDIVVKSGPTKRFLHSYATNITGNGSIILGLEIEANKEVARVANKGYNDEVLKQLISNKKVISTFEMVQHDKKMNVVFADMIRAYKKNILNNKNISLDFKDDTWLASTHVSQNITLSFLFPNDSETLGFMRDLYPDLSAKEFQEKRQTMMSIMKDISDKVITLYPEYEEASFSQFQEYLSSVMMDSKISPHLNAHLKKIALSCALRSNQNNDTLFLSALRDVNLTKEEKETINELIDAYGKTAVFEDLKRKVLENCFSIYLQNPAARHKEVEKMRLHEQQSNPEVLKNLKVIRYPYQDGAHREGVTVHSKYLSRFEPYSKQRFSLYHVKTHEMKFMKKLKYDNRVNRTVNHLGHENLHENMDDYSYVHYVAETTSETFDRSNWDKLNNDTSRLKELSEQWRSMSRADMETYLRTHYSKDLTDSSISAILSLHSDMKDLYNNPGEMIDHLAKGETVVLPVINDCYGRFLAVIPFISEAKMVSKR